MCEFFSAVAFRNGDIVAAPELSDSHEALVNKFKLNEGDCPELTQWVRVELKPLSHQLWNVAPSSWMLTVDELSVPVWANQEWKDAVKTRMLEAIGRMIIRKENDTRWREAVIIPPGARVNSLHWCRIVAADDCKVDRLYYCYQTNNGHRSISGMTVRYVQGGAFPLLEACHIQTLRASSIGMITQKSSIAKMECSQIGWACRETYIGHMADGSLIQTMEDSSVGYLEASCLVGASSEPSNLIPFDCSTEGVVSLINGGTTRVFYCPTQKQFYKLVPDAKLNKAAKKLADEKAANEKQEAAYEAQKGD